MGRGKKRKNYYSDFKKDKRWRGVLDVGMKGFMCACNLRIKECIREAYNLLNEYADKLEPQAEVLPEDQEDESLEDELERELKDMRQKPSQKKFQAVETGGDSTVFISSTFEDPVKLARNIFEDIYTSKQNKTRFLLRLIPVQVTCKAYIEDIRKAADAMFDEPFKCQPLSFNVYYKARRNNSVVRTEVLSAMVTLVRDRNMEHKVDLTNPDKTIVVEITKSVCCLSVVPEFYKYRRYNLAEAAKGDALKANVDDSLQDAEDCSALKNAEDEVAIEEREKVDNVENGGKNVENGSDRDGNGNASGVNESTPEIVECGPEGDLSSLKTPVVDLDINKTVVS
ncbi:Thump domain-containing protein [Nesidiocoris tenuis]|uniref:Thump domain-containing protein n=1 Tax=Nesidiocoris tenuis TaxID=355587 RepID=A0ABN7BFZ6_9HEMI|nr:Thump domain-containing protein [Nesidiocoris tenuis]